MRALEDNEIRHTQPTAGMTRFLSGVKATVLSPGVSPGTGSTLRHRDQQRADLAQARLPGRARRRGGREPAVAEALAAVPRWAATRKRSRGRRCCRLPAAGPGPTLGTRRSVRRVACPPAREGAGCPSSRLEARPLARARRGDRAEAEHRLVRRRRRTLRLPAPGRGRGAARGARADRVKPDPHTDERLGARDPLHGRPRRRRRRPRDDRGHHVADGVEARAVAARRRGRGRSTSSPARAASPARRSGQGGQRGRLTSSRAEDAARAILHGTRCPLPAGSNGVRRRRPGRPHASPFQHQILRSTRRDSASRAGEGGIWKTLDEPNDP